MVCTAKVWGSPGPSGDARGAGPTDRQGVCSLSTATATRQGPTRKKLHCKQSELKMEFHPEDFRAFFSAEVLMIQLLQYWRTTRFLKTKKKGQIFLVSLQN